MALARFVVIELGGVMTRAKLEKLVVKNLVDKN